MANERRGGRCWAETGENGVADPMTPRKAFDLLHQSDQPDRRIFRDVAKITFLVGMEFQKIQRLMRGHAMLAGEDEPMRGVAVAARMIKFSEQGTKAQNFAPRSGKPRDPRLAVLHRSSPAIIKSK